MTLIGAALPILLSALAPASLPAGCRRHRIGPPSSAGWRPPPPSPPRNTGSGWWTAGSWPRPRWRKPGSFSRRPAAPPAALPSDSGANPARHAGLAPRPGEAARPAGHPRREGPRPHDRPRRAATACPSTSCRRGRPTSRAARRSTGPTAPAATATSGRGDGPMAAGLDPAPAESRRLGGAPATSRRWTSTAGSASASSAPRCRPSRTACRPADRWAVALYASTLRLPPASGEAPAGAPGASPRPAGCPTPSCSTRSAQPRTARAAASRAWPRSAPTRARASAAGEVLARVRAQVDSAYALARTGRSRRRHHARSTPT